MTNMR